VPIVCTTLLADQLGWTPGIELLAADTTAEFASATTALYTDAAVWHRVRDAALTRVAREYGAEVFRAALRDALAHAAPDVTPAGHRTDTSIAGVS
jgi:hypothetical protein